MKHVLLVFFLGVDGGFGGYTPHLFHTLEECRAEKTMIEEGPAETRFLNPVTGEAFRPEDIALWNARCVPLEIGRAQGVDT